MEQLPLEVDLERNLAVCAGEPLVFHCHHYNTFLQRTITDAHNLDTIPILVDAASAVARSQLRSHFGGKPELNPRYRMSLAAELFRLQGLGVIDFSRCEAWGGEVRLPFSHYGSGFLSKFGTQEGVVCFFAAGFIEAALEVAYIRPAGSFRAVERKCIAKGDPYCAFEVTRGDPREIYASPGVGVLSSEGAPPRSVETSVDENAIIQAVGGLPLNGNEEGTISAFGVYLSRHYANYYNRISYEFERSFRKLSGAEGGEAATTLLTEAGHVCAFHTFGGIMKSPEWHGLVVPMIRNKEDWIHGIVSVVNALGWGIWRVVELIPGEKIVMRIYDSYESNGYLGMYEVGQEPHCYLATGGVAGLMNLLYHGDITEQPDLTADYYRSLFREEGSFRAAETSCRSKGDPYCEFLAIRE